MIPALVLSLIFASATYDANDPQRAFEPPTHACFKLCVCPAVGRCQCSEVCPIPKQKEHKHERSN